MNRSILIVICDFLLVSLLAFSTVDINKISDTAGEREVKVEIATNQTRESGRDLAAVMRQALDEERKNRDLLMGELTKAREMAQRQQLTLSEREKQLQNYQQQLQTREQLTAQLQQQQADLEKQQAVLEQQFAAAQTNIQKLSTELQSASNESLVSKEKMAALQQQLSEMEKSNQVVRAEQQKLAGQLQVAEVERRHAVTQVAQMTEQVKIEREEKARLTQQATKLAEGVQTLASKSSELATELRENRPLAPNTIFSDFMSNRVAAAFTASRGGMLGESVRRRETQTVLVSDGTNTFALCHVQETPFLFGVPGTDWEGMGGSLTHNSAEFPIRSISFSWPDPRVVLIPLSQEEAAKLGSKIYRISPDPYKFQDAVLVGTAEAYYGECRFEIDPTTPLYLKLDNSFLRGLFGKFNPSRGDLVLSRTGELLGVMANSSYCMMIQKFDSAATFHFGADVRSQKTGETLSRLYAFVTGLPNKLQ